MSSNANVDVNYEDSDGMGNVTLMALPFGKSGKDFYAKVDRNVVNTENLIARAVSKGSGIKPHIMKMCATLFKEELLDALKRGESVNFLGVGTFYPVSVGAVGNTPETLTIDKFRVKCTATKDVQEAVSKLKLNKVSKSDSNPVIEKIIDVSTEKSDGTVVAKKGLRIEGDKLKIGGEKGGVFFAPIDDETGVADESEWIKADTFFINEPMTLAMLLPESLIVGNRYCVIVRTNLTKNGLTRKSYGSTVGSVIKIVSAS